MSTIEHNQDVLRRVIEEGFNQGHLDALDDLFSPDVIEHQFGMRPGVDGLKQDIQVLRTAFPDLHLTIEDMIAEGDKVWIRMVSHATHLGPFMKFPPTGKTVSITIYDTCRFENGRIVEHWGVPDRFALLFQMGVLPLGQGQSAPAGR